MDKKSQIKRLMSRIEFIDFNNPSEPLQKFRMIFLCWQVHDLFLALARPYTWFG